MKRANTSASSARLYCLLLSLFGLTSALAFLPRTEPGLPNFDKRTAALPGGAKPDASQIAAEAQLKARVTGVKVELDEVLGTPKWVATSDGFLSGLEGQGKGISLQTASALAPNEPHRAVKGFLNEHAALFGHNASALDTAKVKRDFVTPHNGLRTVVWQQQLDNIPVFEGLLIGHTTKRGELVNISSRFMPNVEQAANRAVPNRAALLAAPTISADQAIVNAAQNLGETVAVEQVAQNPAQPGEEPDVRRYTAPGLNGETQARLVWLPMDRTTLRLCWEVILTSPTHGEMFRVLIDAETGEAQLRHSLTTYISNASYRVFTSDSPSPFSPGHPTPLTNQPPLVPRVLVVTNAVNTNASPNGWINDGLNETRGNNVDAHLDRNADDSPDLPRPQGSPSRVFDFPLDLSQPPSAYTNAAVVQLFYWNNWMHDKLYELGFTEAAGNFQINNFGRGGSGNDPVQADAQDGSGLNNANMSTPPDGFSARMQMFIFTGPNPDRDGDFDAEVVLHEYTHGLSNRRVGGGVGISTLQAAGMGEGWSDFYALALLSEPGDNLNGNYAAGGYLTFELAPTFRQNYYSGIRRYPYSTDLSKNPLTFKDIDPSQASSHPGVPISPVIGGGGAAEVHNQGEVWCVTLWEARANLINKHGFTVGNRLILQLVTDGMNLSPANPNFLQARDAIIQADRVNNGGANYDELWAAFAKRGMGFFATSPSSSTTAGVQESFSLPDDLSITPVTGFVASGPVGGPFIPMSRTFTVTNIGTNVLVWTAAESAPWLHLSQDGGILNPGGPSETVIATLDSTANSLPMGIYTETILFTNQTSGVAQGRAVTLRVGQPDYFTELFDANDNDLTNLSFTFTPDGSASFYAVCRETTTNFPADPSGATTVVLTDDSFMAVTNSGGKKVSIYGTSSNVFYIGSNGYITLGGGDSNFGESLAGHFSQLRISGFFRDLNPETGGKISWKQFSDRMAVTYLGVPEFGLSNSNSFQIEMFFDGMIRLTYLTVNARNGLVGLSRGEGLPVGFQESDFSAYPICLPRVTVTVPVSAMEGDGLLANQGRVSLLMPTGTNLTVSLASSDTSEVQVPASVIIPAGGTNATFDLTIVDDSDLDGTQNPNIMASAPGYANGTAPLQVFDNETAVLTVSLPANVTEGDGDAPGLVSVSAVPADNILVNLSSSDISEIQVPAFAIIPAGQTSAVFNVMTVDDTQIDGSQTAMVTAHVMNWTDGVATTTVGDNESTNLIVNLPAQAREGNGLLAGAGSVRIAGTLPTNLVVSLLSSDTTEVVVPATLTVPAGRILATFNITIVDDPELDGAQSAAVLASAAGFGSGSSTMNVLDDESPPAPVAPVPPHLSTNNSLEANLAWSPGPGEGLERIVNGGFESGDFTGWVRVASANGNFALNSGTNDPPSPDDPTPPYAGVFNALAQQTGPGLHSMYQQVAIPASAAVVTLSWVDRIRNFAGTFDTNQQFRVEIRNTANTTLAVVFSTSPDDPALGDWVERSVNLSSFRGQTIRLAFIVNPGLFHLDVHLDNVSIRTASPPPTTYDVYFGTQPIPGPGQFLGSTTNTSWDLPTLSPLTTYHWQIVARRLGPTPGPVWRFTTGPAALSIDDVTVTEGNSGTTNAVFTVRLSAVSSQVVMVHFATTNGTATAPTDFASTNGTLTFNPGETNKTIRVAVKGDTVNELTETFFVKLDSPIQAAIENGQGAGTIVNDDPPVLAFIPDRSVLEGTLLTFTATASDASQGASTLITDFENFASGTANGSVLFRDPRNSGSTSILLNTSPNVSSVTDIFPGEHSSARVLQASWSFNSNPNLWLRLTTFNPNNLPNPIVALNQVIKFDIYTDKAIRIGLGLRETTNPAGSPIGTNGGTSGVIEWAGVTNRIGAQPSPTRLIMASNWVTLAFDLAHEPILSFASGNEILSTASGLGVLEHLAFVPAGGIGTYNVYLDNFSVVYSNSLTFSLAADAPEGAAIDPVTGVFTWTPTESQGPSINTITVRVTNNGSPSLTATQSFTLTVLESNRPPALASLLDTNVTEGSLLTIQAVATDPDLPANMLTFSLEGEVPAGATIDPMNGLISWMPAEAQGPGSYAFVVRVTDDGSPSLSATQILHLTVLETNSPPMLAAIADRMVLEETTLTFTNTAPDFDLPANTLSFSLEPGAPDGASIEPATGVLTWAPSELQGPGHYEIVVRVTDDGTPNLSTTRSFTVTVVENNHAPVFGAIDEQTIVEGNTLTLPAPVTDADLPANVLTFGLEPGSPAGAGIDPSTGVLTWTPTEAQGPSTNKITWRSTDNGSPSLSTTQSFTIIVLESNSPPVLADVADRLFSEGSTRSITNTATDADLPANELTFSLDAGAPAGAIIDPVTGVFTWTPSAAVVDQINSFTVRVTDDGMPPLSDAKTFNITVVAAPIIESILISGKHVILSWSAKPGTKYQVLYKKDLAAPKWKKVGGKVTATSDSATKMDHFDPDKQRYYQIEVLP